jgi:hypothetical protein
MYLRVQSAGHAKSPNHALQSTAQKAFFLFSVASVRHAPATCVPLAVAELVLVR